MFELKQVSVHDIVIPSERDREAHKDISDLKVSIQQHTLIQPIVIDENNTLLDGQRRLLCYLELIQEDPIKYGKILARVMPGLAADDKLIIELVSNSERAPFTWYEELDLKSRIHKSLVSRNAEWTIQLTANKLGCALSTMSSDLKLCSAIVYFPELKNFPSRSKASEAYNRLNRQADAITHLNTLSAEDKSKLQNILNIATDTSVTDHNSCDAAYHVDTWQNVLEKIPNGSLGFVEVDPPYAMEFDTKYGAAAGYTSTLTDWTPEQYRSNMEELFLEKLIPKLLPDTWVLIWTAYDWLNWLQDLVIRAGMRTQPAGVWVKQGGHCNTPKTNMISCAEFFLLAAHGKPQFNTPCLNNVITCNSVGGREKIHTNEKPMDLYNHMFAALGVPGSIGFSPFAGSGNVLRAGVKCGMNMIGCDSDNNYYHLFMQRYKLDQYKLDQLEHSNGNE